MGTVIVTQVTPQGLLVPRSALGEWLERGVETVKEKGTDRDSAQTSRTIIARTL